jgi:hypothetical protein
VSEFRCGEAVGSGTPSAGSAAHEFCNPARIWDDVLKQCLELGECRGCFGFGSYLTDAFVLPVGTSKMALQNS